MPYGRRASERKLDPSGTVENKCAEVGADSRIDVDTLAYQSHSPNGHRRVKSLHFLPLSGRTSRENSHSPSSVRDLLHETSRSKVQSRGTRTGAVRLGGSRCSMLLVVISLRCRADIFSDRKLGTC